MYRKRLALCGFVLGGLSLLAWSSAADEPAAVPAGVTTLKGHTEAVYAVAFSPDGGYVATGSFDKTLKLWDAATGKEVKTLGGPAGHQNLVLTAELPGVNPTEVEVRLENNTLYLKGERKLEGNEQSYHQIERVYGPFARAFTLPDSVDTSNVIADFKDGLLTIKLAKRDEAKPRNVKIQLGGSEQKAMAAVAATQS